MQVGQHVTRHIAWESGHKRIVRYPAPARDSRIVDRHIRLCRIELIVGEMPVVLRGIEQDIGLAPGDDIIGFLIALHGDIGERYAQIPLHLPSDLMDRARQLPVFIDVAVGARPRHRHCLDRCAPAHLQVLALRFRQQQRCAFPQVVLREQPHRKHGPVDCELICRHIQFVQQFRVALAHRKVFLQDAESGHPVRLVFIQQAVVYGTVDFTAVLSRLHGGQRVIFPQVVFDAGSPNSLENKRVGLSGDRAQPQNPIAIQHPVESIDASTHRDARISDTGRQT